MEVNAESVDVCCVFQVIPSAVDLVKSSQCGCAVSDILRMEMIVLNKLQWSVKTVTQIDFLHIVSYPNLFRILLSILGRQERRNA